MTTPFRGKLRIRHFEIVLSIADYGSLSKAAGKLQLTLSGLSRAITDIEEFVAGSQAGIDQVRQHRDALPIDRRMEVSHRIGQLANRADMVDGCY